MSVAAVAVRAERIMTLWGIRVTGVIPFSFPLIFSFSYSFLPFLPDHYVKYHELGGGAWKHAVWTGAEADHAGELSRVRLFIFNFFFVVERKISLAIWGKS